MIGQSHSFFLFFFFFFFVCLFVVVHLIPFWSLISLFLKHATGVNGYRNKYIYMQVHNAWAAPCRTRLRAYAYSEGPDQFVQSDQGLHCQLIESLDISECMNG